MVLLGIADGEISFKIYSLYNFVSCTGGDDKRILLWNMGAVKDCIRVPTPSIIKTDHYSNIFTLAFSCDNDHVMSAGGQ